MGRDAESTSATPDGGGLAVLPLRGGEHVGRYVILYTLGKGGMGVVYAAYDPQLDRKVAIKLMRPRPGRRARQAAMLHEAQALARLSDPHVVAIHDVGLIGDRVFVAMDFVDGQTLRRWVQSAPRSVAEIVSAYRQAGEGLAAAHRAGIVHSDFKPDNALIDKQGRVQVLDFGLARVGDGAATPDVDDDPKLAARPRGTPMYMAPEQHAGGNAVPASDQFAFCVSLYEALWRRLPFAGDDAAAIARSIAAGPAPDPPRSPGVSPALRRAILQGLERDPAARHPSMEALDVILRRATARGRRRRRALTAAAVLGVATAAWVTGRALVPAHEPCAGAPTRLADVWNDRRADAIATAFADTGRSHATATAARVRSLLDTFARGWTEQWRSACEATHLVHEQSEELLDLRMGCLDNRRQRLDALVRLLVEADAAVADHAIEATLALPELGACADVGTLRRRVALPEDPRAQAQIDDVRARLAHANALDTAGKTTDAAAIAELAAGRAAELQYAPLEAEANLLWGMVLDTAGRTEEAQAVLLRAAIAAEDAGDDRILADARTQLVAVVGGRLGKLDEARVWSELAAAALARFTRDPRRESRLAHNLALVLEHAGRPEDVLEQQRRALALASEPGASDELERAPLYSDLAMTLSELGQHREALARAEAGLEIWTRVHGEDHPRTAAAIGAIGLVYDHHGDLATARQWYERSHAAFVRVLGADNPRTADMLSNVAIAALELGDVDTGIRGLETVLRIHEQTLGENHPTIAQDHQNLGSALRLVGEGEASLAHHRHALTTREALFGRDDPRVAASLVGVANALEGDLGRPEEALALRQRALAIEERTLGREHPQLCLGVANLAHNLLAVGQREAAREAALRAFELGRDASVGDDTRSFATLVLARVLADAPADRERARTLLAVARGGIGTDVDGAARSLVAAIEAALDD